MRGALVVTIGALGVLGWVLALAAREAPRRWRAGGGDPTLVRLVAAVGVAAIAVGGALVALDAAVWRAAVVAAGFALGAGGAGAGLLGYEGAFVEGAAGRGARRAHHDAPRSTLIGRAVAVAAGLVVIAAAAIVAATG